MDPSTTDRRDPEGASRTGFAAGESAARDVELRLRDTLPEDVGAQYWFRTANDEGALACSGLATHEPKTLVDPRTTFHCFSTTKPITALGVLQLVAEGAVDLDAPLTSYLAELPYQNGATVRQVLSHQAGLPAPMPLSWVHRDEDHATFDDDAFLARVLLEHPHCTKPGRKVRYSNIGFLLLGHLIEAVRGRAYKDAVRAHILDVVAGEQEPGAYLGFDIPESGHASGYTRRWGGMGMLVTLLPDSEHLQVREGAYIGYRPFHLNGAAYGGLIGNALGWAPLLRAIARRDPRLLRASGYDAFFAPQSLASGRPTGHALSWFTGRIGRHDYLCHAGGGPGYGAEIRIYPDLGAASALLTNTTIVNDARHLDQLDRAWLP